MKPDYVDIWICNFNTTQFTNNAIKSIIKNVKSFKYTINIFDNSTIDKFVLDNDIDKSLVKIYDNTQRKILDDSIILKLPQNALDFFKPSYYHMLSIQYIIDNLSTDNMLLMDSDIYLKKDIDFIETDYCVISDLHIKDQDFINWDNNKIEKYYGRTRFVPFIQYLNLKKLKQNKIKYFDYYHTYNHSHCGFDTGSFLYHNVINNKNLKYKQINYTEYIHHYGSASHKKSVIPNNLFFIWFGDNKPNYVNFTIEKYKQINVFHNIQLIHYSIDDLTQICNFPEGKMTQTFKYDHDWLLNSAYHYTLNSQNIKNIDFKNDTNKLKIIYNNYKYMFINYFGGIYLDCDTFPVKPFDKDIHSTTCFIGSKLIYNSCCVKQDYIIGTQKNMYKDPVYSYPINTESCENRHDFINCRLELNINNDLLSYVRHFNLNRWFYDK